MGHVNDASDHHASSLDVSQLRKHGWDRILHAGCGHAVFSGLTVDAKRETTHLP